MAREKKEDFMAVGRYKAKELMMTGDIISGLNKGKPKFRGR